MGLVLLTWFHPGVRQARETNGQVDLFDVAPTTNGRPTPNGRAANGADTDGEVRTACRPPSRNRRPSRASGSAPPGRHSKKGRGART